MLDDKYELLEKNQKKNCINFWYNQWDSNINVNYQYQDVIDLQVQILDGSHDNIKKKTYTNSAMKDVYIMVFQYSLERDSHNLQSGTEKFLYWPSSQNLIEWQNIRIYFGISSCWIGMKKKKTGSFSP